MESNKRAESGQQIINKNKILSRRAFSQKRDLSAKRDFSLKKRNAPIPYVSIAVIIILIIGCIMADIIAPKDPGYLDISNTLMPPSAEFLFGTDSLGRDLWSCIWHGGRISLFIGIFSTLISTVVAIVYGSISGLASDTVDNIMMRFTEIFLSIPSLLLIIFIQAIIGSPNVMTISFVIGITSWASIAKVVRMEVRQLRNSEFIIVSRAMGGSFYHILTKHLIPNFIPSIMFMVIMNIRGAIVAESTLSFMGLGLPIDVISWGSMLSLSQNAMMSGAWWVIFIAGAFLVVLLIAITNIGNWYRHCSSHKESNI